MWRILKHGFFTLQRLKGSDLTVSMWKGTDSDWQTRSRQHIYHRDAQTSLISKGHRVKLLFVCKPHHGGNILRRTMLVNEKVSQFDVRRSLLRTLTWWRTMLVRTSEVPKHSSKLQSEQCSSTYMPLSSLKTKRNILPKTNSIKKYST
jgi:hypothetical protein